MTTSEEMAIIAMWMMIVGGMVGFFGLAAIIQSASGVNRGDMSKPLTIVGLGLFLLGGFLQFRWGAFL